jgi:molybdenum cofactor guanylyltransferase
MNGTTERDIAVAILAGGESRRMGRDKAVLELDGQTLLERTIGVAHAVTDIVTVVGRSPTGDADQVALWLEDETPGLGPIGGLETALAHLQRPTILLGCDMPLVDQAALEWLVETFATRPTSATHGVATVRDGRIEPLFSVYMPSVSALVDEMIAEGRRSLTGLIERGAFGRVEVPDVMAEKLVNVNTPAEFRGVLGG